MRSKNPIAIVHSAFMKANDDESFMQAMRIAERAYTKKEIGVDVLYSLANEYAERIGPLGREFQTRVCDDPYRPAFQNVWQRHYHPHIARVMH